MLVRKTVTAVFCDVTDSTSLGERLDPESHRRVMTRYFDEMRAVVERHGGTVEKFIGDAVMALFGVPVVHEDDALRGVRAAAEMQRRVGELNEELEASYGVRLQVKIGVNTGEVVSGGDTVGGTLATGDAINVAARLQQAAEPGEILIGTATYPLVKHAVAVGPKRGYKLKGKSGDVATWRLDRVDASAAAIVRRLDAPLIGRIDDLRGLREAFDAAAAERACRLVTVLGPAGIGKSRLVGELLGTLGEQASALAGRCLPYGEGITYWPLVEMVRALGGEQAVDEVLAGHHDAAAIATQIRGAIGASAPAGSPDETFWAVRRLFEALAERRPLIVCFEDIHWAEPTLLDLIEYLAGWSRGRPILLVCIARSDLLDHRPGWLTPRPNANVVVLEPLATTEADALVESLLGDVQLDSETRARIAEAAEGNPLFVEQIVALHAEDPQAAGWAAVPRSIQALLAERLDRLAPEERELLERAAVVGRDFPLTAVAHLSRPEIRSSVATLLLALRRRGLVTPDPTPAFQGDGYRFRHILIRDAAYAGMSLEARAELHEQFADWIERTATDRVVELGEIVGYHVEQAFAARAALGRGNEVIRGLGVRAAHHLGSAGRRALTRGDVPAAANLLGRAASLLEGSDAPRAEVLLDLSAALREHGDTRRADAVLQESEQASRAAGDERLALRALIERSVIRLYVDPEAGAADALDVAERATPVFEAHDDDRGLSRAWGVVAEAHWMRSRFAAMETVLERALPYAEAAADRRQASWIRGAMCRATLVGPRPVDDAIRRCTEIGDAMRDDPTLRPVIDAILAPLNAMRGDIAEARERYRASQSALQELGVRVQLASLRMYAGWAELIAGDPAAAERLLRIAYDELARMGERSYLSTMAAFLAQAVDAQGRSEEAEMLTAVTEKSASPDDLVSQVMWRATRATILARRGDSESAVGLARRAVELSRETDFLNMQADALVALAQTLAAADRSAEATEPTLAAIRLYDAKGNVVASRSTAQFIEERLASSSA